MIRGDVNFLPNLLSAGLAYIPDCILRQCMC